MGYGDIRNCVIEYREKGAIDLFPKVYRLSECDASSKRVGWNSAGILRFDDPQEVIYTCGLSACYALVGRNATGDIILGHYYSSTSRSEALSIVQALVDGESPHPSRILDPRKFKFEMLRKPCKSDGLFWDIYCSQDGIRIIEY